MSAPNEPFWKELSKDMPRPDLPPWHPFNVGQKATEKETIDAIHAAKDAAVQAMRRATSR